MPESPNHWSAQTIVERIRGGAATAREITDACLERIDTRTAINAFITVAADTARAAATDKDTAPAPQPLRGLPFAIKDNICVAGLRCTCASRMLADWVAPYDATAVARLRAAGAVIVGKTNGDEFGMGSSSENSHFGPVKNPHDPTRTAGGSSGGSAAAVADYQCAVALGSDTGGSVRQPAAFCGVFGLKPTYGAVSRWGLVAYGSSLDQIGVFARTTGDLRLTYDIIRGHDPQDATSLTDTEPRAFRNNPPVIGLPREYYGEGLDPEIRESVKATEQRLRESGCTIREISLPHAQYAIAAYYIIATAEASSNLARYDGVRYGHRARTAEDLHEMYCQTRAEGFGTEVKRRILLGSHVLSAGYYDQYYATAQRVRAAIAQDFAAAFADVDCILTPTTPTPAFALGEKIDDPLTMYLNDIYTTSVNLAGLPAVSFPCGTTQTGLPIGAQLIGPALSEHAIVDLADWVTVPTPLPGVQGI